MGKKNVFLYCISNNSDPNFDSIHMDLSCLDEKKFPLQSFIK